MQLQHFDWLNVDVLLVENRIDLDFVRRNHSIVDEVVAGNDEQQVFAVADFVQLE